MVRSSIVASGHASTWPVAIHCS